ncbi:MAG: hypothetical protein K2W95_33870 [Candidatus Obscuribacterales bacterium]|nr:hypothetical protein [Candidatus Obscuribacterales bacterium]
MILNTVPEVSGTDIKLLRNHLLDGAARCVHSAEGALNFRYVTPTAAVKPGGDDDAAVPERSSIGHYLQMYDWDSCFFSQVAQVSPDLNGKFDGLALDVVKNFLLFQEADGYVPRTISPQRIWDKGDQCKPFLCQTLVVTNNTRVDDAILKDLDKYLQYFVKTRRDERGLYRWRNVLESGVDNNLALLAPGEAAKDENFDHTVFPDGQLLACDLSAYLYAEFFCFSKIARASGDETLALQYDALAQELRSAIDEHLWNPALSLYCNLHPSSGEFVSLRCWTGLVPVLVGGTSEQRAEEVIERNLMSEAHFFRPAGIPSVAVSERLYNQARRGLYGRVMVSNWQGPVWVLTNGMVVRCLLRLGLQDKARAVAARMINTLVLDLKTTGTLHENYDAETSAALFAPNFMSWNIMALEMLPLLEI